MASTIPATSTDDHVTPVITDSGVYVARLANPDQIVDAHVDTRPGWMSWLRATPAWLVSTLLHVTVIMIFGLVTLTDPRQVVNVLTAALPADEGPEIEEFTIESVELDEPEPTESAGTSSFDVVEPVDPIQEIAMVVPTDTLAVPLEVSELASEMAPAATKLQSLSTVNMPGLSSRGSDMKNKMLRKYGGTPGSEAAVAEALKWLARHQAQNGGWTFNHSVVCRGRCRGVGAPRYSQAVNSATSLALLPFLGAGQTHYEGEYQQLVRKGLLFLIGNGRKGTKGGVPMIDFTEKGGSMYAHGLATIALSEAYAMTGDPALQAPTQAALNFIVYAQCRDGGWRYRPQQESGGDTSVVGWQLMALKSGYMGHLVIPPRTIQRSTLFLNRVQGMNGAVYGYSSPPKRKKDNPKEINVRPACTAIGLLCRMYTGWDRGHPALQQGVEELAKIGVLKNNIYYDYYAAQVLRHHGGSEWESFNTELRDWLVDAQSQDGGAQGSWHFPEAGGHTGPLEGGRLLSTSFATMILEVYYRHMPLYADAAAEEDFPL